MDQYDIHITILPQCDSLPGSYGHDVHLDIVFLFEAGDDRIQ